MNRTLLSVTFLSLAVFFFSSPAAAQTTSLKFQGQLEMSSAPANGNFDFEFLLFDALAGGGQVGATEVRNGVNVTNGSFSVDLNFGDVFPGDQRFIEIRVRPAGAGAFTVLAPRQPVRSAPYSIRSLAAATADSVAVTGVPGGSVNYIQNSTTKQPSSDFNISGDGTAGGTFSGNIVDAATQYNIGGTRVLASVANGNLFIGENAGISNAGNYNTFVGTDAGLGNSTGEFNTFVGTWAGKLNTTGFSNSAFGTFAGGFTTTGNSNSFFGFNAGASNSEGSSNSFVGTYAGANNTTGNYNAFFGTGSGILNTTGSYNAYFGDNSGGSGITAGENAFFGAYAGAFNTSNGNSFFGFRSGQANTIGAFNSFFGWQSGVANTTGQFNSMFGYAAGSSNTDGDFNSFFGFHSGKANTSGDYNSYYGYSSGRANTTGIANSFFGYYSGYNNTVGGNNAYLGYWAGSVNLEGSNNTIIGALANVGATNLTYAAAIGAGSVVNTSNTIVLGRETGADRVIAYGRARIGNIPLEASAAQVCFNAFGDLLQCGASSLRWKTDVRPLDLGLKTILALRPISYVWKESGTPDFGLGAEDVAAAAPELAFFDYQGEAQGVKYDRITTVLVNAVKEQQKTIEVQSSRLKAQGERIGQLEAEVASLKAFVCASNPGAAACK